MSSSAFQDLDVRLDEVRLLGQMDPQRVQIDSRGPGEDAGVATSNALNRACIVLLCSHLEGFLEDLVVESLDMLATLGAPVDNLPLLLRALHVEEHLRELEPIKDRHSRAPRIEKMFRNEGGLWSAGAQVTTSMLRHATVCSQMSNPGSREVRNFLQLLGVDIDERLRATGSGNLLGRINGLVQTRNSIAHGERDTRPTYRDVDDYLALVEDLAREIDAALAEEVKTISAAPSLPW